MMDEPPSPPTADPALAEAPPFAPPPAAMTSAPRRRSSWRGWARYGLGVLLALDLLLLFAALSLTQVTAEGPATRSLRHSVAILAEIDAYLDTQYDALRQEASATESRTVEPPDFPVAVSFTPDEVLASDRASFRNLLLDRATGRLYDEGASVLREEGAPGVDTFSAPGAVRQGLDLLRPTPHRVLNWVTVGLAIAAAVLAGGLALACRGYGRVVGIGIALSWAAVSFLIVSMSVRFAFRVGADGSDDYFSRQFLALGEELAWGPLRDAIILSVGGAAVLLLGMTLAFWSDRTRPA